MRREFKLVCFVKKIYRLVFPKCVREFVFVARSCLPHFFHIRKFLEHNRVIERYKEHFESYGEDYPDKVFFVIYTRYATSVVSFIRIIIPYLQYAEKNGWIPVIDQKTYDYTFLGKKKECVKNGNIWELFFEQPLGFSLDDIKNAKNVCYCNPLQTPEGYSIPKNADGMEQEVLNCFEKYIRFKKDVKDEIMMIANKCNFNPKKKYIGVNIRCEMLRGAMIKSNLYINHSYSTKEQIFDAIENVKSIYDSESYGVFIICDDPFVKVNLARQFAPYNVIWLDRHFYITSFFENGDLSKPLGDKFVYKNILESDFSQCLENFYEYLADVYSLSKCDAVLCGKDDSAPFMASLFKGAKFSKYYFFYNNIYNGEDKEKYLYEDKKGYVALH